MLKKFINNYTETKKEFNNIKNNILSHTITEKIIILENKLNNTKREVKELEREQERLKENQEKLRINDDKRIIENLLTKITNKKIIFN